jgi:hypothetical protein
MTVVSRWPRDYSQKDIAHEANLGAGATHTIVDWCSFCQSKTRPQVPQGPAARRALGFQGD